MNNMRQDIYIYRIRIEEYISILITEYMNNIV